MKNRPAQGFALILVLIAVFSTSVVLLVVAKNARNLCFEADRAQVLALTENLQASALHWATLKVHPNGQPLMSTEDSVHLDPNRLSDRPATITISAETLDANRISLTIDTDCRYSKQQQSESTVHTLPLRP